MSLCESCTKSITCSDAAEDMAKCPRYSYSYYEKYCLNCQHRRPDTYPTKVLGVVSTLSHCALYSTECITDVFNHRTPRSFLAI